MVESEAALKYLFKCRCRLFDCELSSASLFRHGVYYDSAAGGAVVPQSAVDLFSAEALAADNNRRVQALLSGNLHISCCSGASTAWLPIDHNPSL